MSWTKVIGFQVALELCPGTTHQTESEPGPSGERLLTVRCEGCGASLTVETAEDDTADQLMLLHDILVDELGLDANAMNETEEGRAQLLGTPCDLI